MTHSDKKLDPQILEFFCRGNIAFSIAEMDTSLITVSCVFLKFNQLHAPWLPECSTLFCCFRFRPGCINKYIKVAAGVHQMQDRNCKPTMSASQTNRHFVLFGKLKIAMNFAHHVQHNFVRRITPVHTSVKFTGGHGADFLSSVV